MYLEDELIIGWYVNILNKMKSIGEGTGYQCIRLIQKISNPRLNTFFRGLIIIDYRTIRIN